MREYEMRVAGVGVAPSEEIARSECHPAVAVGASFPDSQPTSRARRVVDVLGSVSLIVLLSPVFAAIALAVRLSSPGPVIYRQTRVGINRRSGIDRRAMLAGGAPVDRRRVDRRTIASAGDLFRICKFRTMIDGAETRVGPTWAAKNDGRVTALGRFLRRTRLDELPQLLNVLQGDMSFLGPRPERPFFVEKFRRQIPGYMERLTVAPGISGLAQVEHKYDTDVEDVRLKLEYDVRYIRNRGLRQDLQILLKTFRVVVSGSGAH